MAVIKKTELDAMDDAAKAAKITELERAILELQGEGQKAKIKPLKKAIAKLKASRPKTVKKKPTE